MGEKICKYYDVCEQKIRGCLEGAQRFCDYYLRIKKIDKCWHCGQIRPIVYDNGGRPCCLADLEMIAPRLTIQGINPGN